MFTLKKLTEQDIEYILRRALEAESPQDESGQPLTPQQLDDEMLSYLSIFADGDARTALNLLELAISLSNKNRNFTKDDIKKALTRTLVYDRSGDMHFDTISAFHKSVRGSNADGALFWLGRMLKGGEVGNTLRICWMKGSMTNLGYVGPIIYRPQNGSHCE